MVDETNMAYMAEAQNARIVRGNTEEWLYAQEDEIIARLVNKYRAGTLTSDHLHGSIGEIAGLRTFREHLEQSIRRGNTAAIKELEKDGKRSNQI